MEHARQEDKRLSKRQPDQNDNDTGDNTDSQPSTRSSRSLIRSRSHSRSRAHSLTRSHSPSSLIGRSRSPALGPIKIPGLIYHEINLNGFSYSTALMQKLSWTDSVRLIAYMGAGYKEDAISILGRNVLSQRGLVGLAIDSLTHSHSQILAVFMILATPAAYPVVVHCTQGKDRTGLIILLMLLLCGVPSSAIKTDYLLSRAKLADVREEKVLELQSIGLPESFADCPEDWVDRVVEHIDKECNGIEAYLTKCNVTQAMQTRIKEALVDDDAHT